MTSDDEIGMAAYYAQVYKQHASNDPWMASDDH